MSDSSSQYPPLTGSDTSAVADEPAPDSGSTDAEPTAAAEPTADAEAPSGGIQGGVTGTPGAPGPETITFPTDDAAAES